MREDLLGFAASSLSVLLRLAAIDRYGAIDTSTDSSADSAVSLSVLQTDRRTQVQSPLSRSPLSRHKSTSHVPSPRLLPF